MPKTWTEYLTRALGYPSSRIVKHADAIAVYRDAGLNECFAAILGSSKKDLFGNLLDAVSDHTRSLSPEYYVLGSPERHTIYHASTPHVSVPDSFPIFPEAIGKQDAVVGPLMPFRDEAHLRKCIRSLHDKLFQSAGKDPAAAFDVVTGIIAAKLFDERRNPSKRSFHSPHSESPPAAADRLSSLIASAYQFLGVDGV
ncbi:MAG: hypothetical protein AB7K09_22090, partial [Planctomycetota bacterium]